MGKHTPVEVKKLNGTFRDDRQIADYARLNPSESVPTPPPTLHKDAHDTWYSMAYGMTQMKTLTSVDWPILEAYCYQKYIRDKAVKALETQELIEETNRGATQIINNNLQIINRCDNQMIELSKALGLTPLHRSNIGVNKSMPNDPLSGLLKGSK